MAWRMNHRRAFYSFLQLQESLPSPSAKSIRKEIVEFVRDYKIRCRLVKIYIAKTLAQSIYKKIFKRTCLLSSLQKKYSTPKILL